LGGSINEKLRKEWDAERKIEHKFNRIIIISTSKVMDIVKDKKPMIFSNFHYGSIGINPKYLVIWYLFEKDSDLKEAESNGSLNELKQLTIFELKANGHLEDVLDEIQIAFTSDEDLLIETGGNYWYYFK